MSIDHYENFPVASILLPKRLRRPVHDIYRFARCADDIADEGNASASERLTLLSQYRQALQQLQQGQALNNLSSEMSAVFLPLRQTLKHYRLPFQPFYDLLSAFEQDVTTTRYSDDSALLDYCQRSADPIGRLMLHLYQASTPENLQDADSICTGLQLTNFWQDVAIDWNKNRIYIPRQAMHEYGIDETFIAHHAQGIRPDLTAIAWKELMHRQVQQARRFLMRGQGLTQRLPGRIGFELRLVVLGGLRILERLEQVNYDMFTQRPTLGKRDWLRLLWRAC